jgi:DNA mismatch endonuclease (patch repair protein)
MSRVRSKDTTPEYKLRRLLHALGYRFRLHRKDLPGRPDLVFPGRRKVVFIHGCWWHRHPGCRKAGDPKSNLRYWEQKFRRNVERDAWAAETLKTAGWQVLIVWECELKNLERLQPELTLFLDTANEGPRMTELPLLDAASNQVASIA